MVKELKVQGECKTTSKLFEYFCKHGLDKLRDEFPIYICPHSKYPHLVHFSFKVSSLVLYFEVKEFHTEVKMNEILEESSGSLVVDTKETPTVISFAFPRIYDYFHEKAPQIDWNSGFH